MIYRNVLVLLERDAIQPVGQSEHAFYHVAEFKVGAQHLRIEVVLGQLKFVGVETEVPRLHGEVLALGLACRFADFLHLFQCRRLVCVNETVEQAIHIAAVSGHAALEHVVGIGLAAQQLRNLPAQVDESFADFNVVFRVVVRTLSVLGHIHPAAQLPLGRVGHEGRVAWEVECEHPSLLVLLLGRVRRSLNGRVGQSLKVAFIGYVERKRLVLLEQVLRKLQRQHTGFLRELAQPLLALVVEQGSTAHEAVIAVVEQLLLLGGELAVVTVYGLYALKQLFVEPHIVGVLGQYGLHLLCQSVHLVVGLRTQQIEKH